MGDITRTRIHILPTLQHKRRSTCAGKCQCSKDARRPESDDHRAHDMRRAARLHLRGRLERAFLWAHRNHCILTKPCAHRALIRDLYIQLIDPDNRCSSIPACIQRFSNDMHLLHSLSLDAKTLCCKFFYGLHCIIGNTQVLHPYHCIAPTLIVTVTFGSVTVTPSGKRSCT